MEITLFAFSTVGVTVESRNYLFCTVGRDYGRQFRSHFLNFRLSRRHETTVQKQERVSHTVVSKHDFPKQTVGKQKGICDTADIAVFRLSGDSRIRQNQLMRLQIEMKSTLKRQLE